VCNRLFLKLSFYDEIDGNHEFIAKEIENNEVVNTTVILSVASERNSRRGDFIFKKSDDGSKYLVAKTYGGYRDTNINYRLVLIDNNLDTVLADNNTIISKVKRGYTCGLLDISLSRKGGIVLVVRGIYREVIEKTALNYFRIYTYDASFNS